MKTTGLSQRRHRYCAIVSAEERPKRCSPQAASLPVQDHVEASVCLSEVTGCRYRFDERARLEESEPQAPC